MSKIDLKKEEKHLYSPSRKEIVVVDVPPMNFLMIDGAGDPNTSQDFQDACEALYGVAYTLKFMSKNALGHDHVVMPLEGLWWAEDMAAAFSGMNKDEWLWTIMIRQPDHLTQEHVEAAMAEVARKKNPAALSKVRFETYHEGLAVQIMYIGPYAEEAPTIAQLHEYAESNGYKLAGKHHEIYLSDPGRTAPEKMRTVIRQPIQKA